ncbi:MAG: gamma-glutamyltransferase [Gammaproteobacteria bacterium]|nr:gamma-glutamyltransferase [Gammaproteobacteria bacterium]
MTVCKRLARHGFIAFLLLPAVAIAAGQRVPDQAAIASAHPLATEAGLEILEQGGNAFDAAVAVSAALAVVEPYSSGTGGGGFWLLHQASSDRDVFVDGREVAPCAATKDMYLDEEGNPIPRLSLDGPLAAGIPGHPAALAHIASQYGRLPLAASLAPAIRYAAEGFPAYERIRDGLEFKRELIGRWPAAAEIFLDDGEVPAEGALIRQPELAATLRVLAEKGRDGFYAGEVARRLVQGVRDAGGIWTLADLASYRVVEREPIHADYRGVRITTAPPPSAGGVALIEILNILSAYELKALEGAARKHLVVEAMRRAYRDRAEFLGDPDFVDAPLKRLLHPWYAAGLRNSIRTDRATPSSMLPGIRPAGTQGTQTTHFSVLDGEGNRVAATLSINFWFGSGFMPEGTGVLLNNEMNDFSIKPGVPDGYQLVGADANAIAPGKRMLSSMMPTVLESDEGIAILGTPGGSRIISMVLLGTLAWIDGASAEQMVALPRYHHQYLPDQVFYETAALSEEEQAALRAMGHELAATEDEYGNMQVVTWDFENGEVEAASDPRGVGEGLVY